MARNNEEGATPAGNTHTYVIEEDEPPATGIPSVDELNATIAGNHVDSAEAPAEEPAGDDGEGHPNPDQTGPGSRPGDEPVDAPQARDDPAAVTTAAEEAPNVYTLGDRLLEFEAGAVEGDTAPSVKIGDMVLYHGKKPFPPAYARGDHPAIVTAIQPPAEEGGPPVLWLAVFLPTRMESAGAVSAGDGPGQWSHMTYPTLPF